MKRHLIATSLALAAICAASAAQADDPPKGDTKEAPKADKEAPKADDASKADKDAAKKPESDEEKADHVHVRGGFTIGGGVGFGDNTTGAMIGAGFRLGVQFNRWFGLYYQNSPMVSLLASNDGGSVHAGFLDYNSGVLNLSLAHIVEIGAGPSGDYVSIASCNLDTAGCASDSRFAFGVHSRFAINPFAGAFHIGVDAHPIFLPGGTLTTITAGLGGEWF